MERILTTFLLTFIYLSLHAQSPGDTIIVQGFNFNSAVRDTVIEFPNDPNLTFEKVILRYTMRCPDALVNDGSNTRGCGEWDFSCNTYLVDSSKIESVLTTTPSHNITFFDQPVFSYSETPVYNLLRSTQYDVAISSAINETTATVGTGTESFNRPLNTAKIAGKAQYLYTAAELTTAGLTAGNIEGLSLNVLADGGETRFLKLNLKQTTKTELNGLVDLDGFTEVYHQHTTLVPNQTNRFNFYTPFEWDGTSNIIVESTFTNLENSNATQTLVEGTTTTQNIGLTSTNEQELILTENAYVECDDYLGVTGGQERTIEAWVKTTDGSDGEICSWGTIMTGRKWVLRFKDGRLRLEVTGGGTESTTLLNDGEWHHIACVMNGNNISDIVFYIDGVLDPNFVVGNQIVDTGDSPLRISRGVNTRYLNATIDDVRIWDTNLPGATINEWKNLKIDASHPNYANLQLNYEFDETGLQIEDSSVNDRSATIIGNEFRTAQLDGASLFKDFSLTNQRPNLVFYQGDYIFETVTTEVDKPIAKELAHFVMTSSINPNDPTLPFHDDIQVEAPVQHWTLDQKIYDEATGELIAENTLPADGEIIITDLEYMRRFPFYNELVSFVTPYGFFLDLGVEGNSWFMDMSDYVSILKGKKRIQMTLGGQFNEAFDMDFMFIVGTPPREVIQYEQIWQGTNRQGIARIAEILDDTKFDPANISLNAEGESFKLKSSITGHGSEGEFHQNGGTVDHKIMVDQQEIFNWDITQECSFNPIFPQGGTWVYDRQGWCPGEQSLMNEQNLTPFVNAGGTLNIDYSTSAPSSASGDYRYHVAHQLIGYGPANFQLDAALTGIIAPNNTAEFIRVGNICANPKVVIRNTGATPLTALTINYWINESQSPQTFEWTGNLDFMEEEIVEIPSTPALWFDILSADNVFHAEIASPNQGADEYSFNNQISSSFDFPQVLPSKFTIEVKTNFIPTQNSYQLVDAAGNVVGSNALTGLNILHSDDYDLPQECLKLIFVDTGGDGLQWWANPNQGAGSATIRDENGTIIKNFEPDFGGGFEYSFTTDFAVSSEDLAFLTSIKVFPNPASHYCSIEADDLSDASISLTDALGRTIQPSILSRSENLITLDLENINAGLYFIVIEKEEVITTRKLLVD